MSVQPIVVTLKALSYFCLIMAVNLLIFGVIKMDPSWVIGSLGLGGVGVLCFVYYIEATKMEIDVEG